MYDGVHWSRETLGDLQIAAKVATGSLIVRPGEPVKSRWEELQVRYLMRKKLFAIGDDYWIEDEQGQRVLKVDGKVLRLRKTFVLVDVNGAEVATIEKHLMSLRETMDIERGGQVIARVRKALFAPFKQRYDVAVDGQASLVIQGNITDHEYEVTRGEMRVAAISKRWFTVRDTYAVDVAPEEDVGLVVALTVAVDWMGHEEDGR